MSSAAVVIGALRINRAIVQCYLNSMYVRINPLMPNPFFHLNYLDRSISCKENLHDLCVGFFF